MNNDTVIDKNALLEMVKLSESNEKIGMVGSKLLYYNKQNIIQVLGGTSQITWRSFGISICSFEKDQIKFNNNFEIKGSLIGASLLVKKEVIKTTGIFDENYFLFAEETDWEFRASKIGWKLFCSGKSKIWHKVGASSVKSVQKVFLGRQSIMIFIAIMVLLYVFYFKEICLKLYSVLKKTILVQTN